MEQQLLSTIRSTALSIGLVGAGKGGTALFDLLLNWPEAKVAVVIDPRAEAPAISKAKAFGIPTAVHHLEVFRYDVDLVLEVTGHPSVLDDLLRAKSPGLEVIGAAGLRFFWNLLEDKVNATRQAEEHAEKLATLSRLTRLITATPDSREVFNAVAKAAATLLGAKMARLWVDDPVGQVLQAQGSFGIDPHLEQSMTDFSIFPYGKGLVGSVIESRTPEYCLDVQQDSRTRNQRLAKDLGLHAFAGLPLRAGDHIVGVLALFFGNRPPFTREEQELMSLLADQAAIAIENARLFEETERRRQAAESLAEVGLLISQSLDPEEVGQQIADSVRALLGAAASTLFRLEPESGDLVSLAASGEMRLVFGGKPVFPRGTGVPGLAVRERHPVVTLNVLTDPRIVLTPEMRDRIEQVGLRAVLAVPLLVKDQVIGALGVGDRAGRVFEPDEIRLAQAFAAQAAIALENSRLYGELRSALEQVTVSQQQLVQVERLRALGEMAAGVAHDFNNLLAVILGRAELLLARVNDPDLVRGLTVMRDAALDGAQTVRRIQEFTRTRRTRPFGRVDLVELLQEVVELTRPRWKDEAQSRGVSYEVRVEGGPVPPVAGISEELREVFTNLLTNALEAMPAGGRVSFSVSADADKVMVTAEDSGCGMSEETHRRVFEPFFTTKGPRGTGLGLAVAWGIITRHGGTIEVKSTIGTGSTFTVRLPIGQEFPSEEKRESVPRPPRAARVLVIDDEPEVRRVLRDLLTAEGYTVLEAADGAEGLARCEAESVDLVLSDISMPKMSGWEAAAASRARFPRLPVGFITGWGDQLDPDKLDRHGVRFVLAKPFAASDVLRQVAEVLNPTATTPDRPVSP